MTSAQRWTWILLATLIGLSIVFMVALPAWGDGGHPNCERYPWKCQQTTTTQPEVTTTTTGISTTTTVQESTTSTPTTTSESSSTTSTAAAPTTTSGPVSSTSPDSPSTPTEPSSTEPSSTDPTVAPADAGSQLPDTGLSHDVWAGLTFAAFVLLTMGGMAVLAGRDDDE